MQDTELFLSLAEIAGVFVGFGALISVRSGAVMGVSEINSWPKGSASRTWHTSARHPSSSPRLPGLARSPAGPRSWRPVRSSEGASCG
jgi:hypothetical protein